MYCSKTCMQTPSTTPKHLHHSHDQYELAACSTAGPTCAQLLRGLPFCGLLLLAGVSCTGACQLLARCASNLVSGSKATWAGARRGLDEPSERRLDL